MQGLKPWESSACAWDVDSWRWGNVWNPPCPLGQASHSRALCLAVRLNPDPGFSISFLAFVNLSRAVCANAGVRPTAARALEWVELSAVIPVGSYWDKSTLTPSQVALIWRLLPVFCEEWFLCLATEACPGSAMQQGGWAAQPCSRAVWA